MSISVYRFIERQEWKPWVLLPIQTDRRETHSSITQWVSTPGTATFRLSLSDRTFIVLIIDHTGNSASGIAIAHRIYHFRILSLALNNRIILEKRELFNK